MLPTRADLIEILRECAVENWDGYGAIAVGKDAVVEAAGFLAVLGQTVITPEAVPEPDGCVGLAWDNSAGDTLVVSFGGSVRVSFAAVFSEGERLRGTEVFTGDVPVRIGEVLASRFLARRDARTTRVDPARGADDAVHLHKGQS